MDLNIPPPLMGQKIHRWIRRETGVRDPYQYVKQRFNQKMMRMYEQLNAKVKKSEDPLEMAVRLAIAGNIIDLGANPSIDSMLIQEAINRALIERLDWEREDFVEATRNAESILYLTDNAGEIVLDRILIELLPKGKITVAVRGFPILNDATLIDTEEVGLTHLVSVIDNGSDAPGTILADCNDVFLDRFYRADLIIAKGQGNYETLSDINHNIFFLLKAKCPVVARDIGCKVGAMIAKQNNRFAYKGITEEYTAPLFKGADFKENYSSKEVKHHAQR